MPYMIAVSLEMSDEPNINRVTLLLPDNGYDGDQQDNLLLLYRCDKEDIAGHKDSLYDSN